MRIVHIDGRSGADRTVRPGEPFQVRGRVRAGLWTSSPKAGIAANRSVRGPLRRGPLNEFGRCVGPSHDAARPSGLECDRCIRSSPAVRRSSDEDGGRVNTARTRQTATDERFRPHAARGEETRSVATRHAHASGGPGDVRSHAYGCACADECVRCVARPRIRPRGCATTRAPGPKLVVLYPCALDRVRYTSEGRMRERECWMKMRDEDASDAIKKGRQDPRMMRAVCALRAYARRARAVKRVDARDGRAEEAQR